MEKLRIPIEIQEKAHKLWAKYSYQIWFVGADVKIVSGQPKLIISVLYLPENVELPDSFEGTPIWYQVEPGRESHQE